MIPKYIGYMVLIAAPPIGPHLAARALDDAILASPSVPSHQPCLLATPLANSKISPFLGAISLNESNSSRLGRRRSTSLADRLFPYLRKYGGP